MRERCTDNDCLFNVITALLAGFMIILAIYILSGYV